MNKEYNQSKSLMRSNQKMKKVDLSAVTWIDIAFLLLMIILSMVQMYQMSFFDLFVFSNG